MVMANEKAMVFELSGNGGNCLSCVWISAEGEITENTPNDFIKFLNEQYKPPGKPFIVLHSGGGNLISGIKLGYILRDLNFSTSIGETVPDDVDGWTENVEPGYCHSACAYAFLGGAARNSGDNPLGFHQFYDSRNLSARVADLLENETGFSTDQLVSSLLAKYLIDTGVDVKLLALASSADPQSLFIPNSEQRKDLMIDFSFSYEFEEWRLEPYKNGLLMYAKRLFPDQHNPDQITMLCRGGQLEALLTEENKFWQNVSLLNDSYTFKFSLFKASKEILNSKIENRDVKEWTGGGRFYVSVKIPIKATALMTSSDAMSLSIQTASALGNWYGAYVEFNDLDNKAINLIMRNCI